MKRPSIFSMLTPSSDPQKSNWLVAFRWSPWLPPVLLTLLLVLSFSVFWMLRMMIVEQQRTRFNREVLAHTTLLRQRFNEFEKVLQATRAFWLSGSNPPKVESFYNFSEQMGLNQYFPEVQAMGFLAWLPQCDAANINKLRRDFELPNLRISPRRSRQACVPVTMIAPPNSTNLAILGYNAYYEETRRDSIDVMRHSSFMQTSRPIHLLQQIIKNDRRSQGFLVMLPVWRDENDNLGVAGEDQLDGFVYLAVHADDLLLITEETVKGRKAYQDGTQISQVDDIVGSVTLAGETIGRTGPYTAVFEHTETVRLAGQDWKINYVAPQTFGSDRLSYVPHFFLAAGVLLSLLAYSALTAQVRARRRAEEVNIQLSNARFSQERARAQFEAIFQSMQDGAAFTDLSGNIQMVNRALTEQFGVERASLVGQPLEVLHRQGAFAEDSAEDSEAVTSPLKRSDGTIFYGETQRATVKNHKGGILGHLEVIRDVTERVDVEKALRVAERRSRASLDAIPHVIWVSDMHGEMLDTNAIYRARLGELPLRHYVHEDDLGDYDDMWQDVYAMQARTACVVRLKANSIHEHSSFGTSHARFSRYRWFDIKVVPMLNEDGKPSQWVASATDIHDRLLAERQTQRSEKRYRGVIDSVPQIIWLTDALGNTMYVNRRWAEYVGQERGQANLLEVTHPEDLARFKVIRKNSLERSLPFEVEHRLLGKDGMYRTFVTRGIPVHDNDGNLLEWVSTCTDIDDTVYAENASRLLADISEVLTPDPTQSMINLMSFEAGRWHSERYSAALQLISDRIFQASAIWTTDRILLDVLKVSASEDLIAKLPPCQENVVRLGASQVGREWNNEEVYKLISYLVEKVLITQEVIHGEPEEIANHPIIDKLGIVGARMAPLYDSKGNLLAVLGISHNYVFKDRDHALIDEIIKRFATSLENDGLRMSEETTQREIVALNSSLEEQVGKRTAELQETNKELEAFSYSVSHDLRSPLRHIISFAEILSRDKSNVLSDKSNGYVKIINESALRLLSQIDSLLEFSRNSRKQLNKRQVNLNNLVSKVWKTLEPDRKDRQIDFSSDKLPDIPADPALLELVFQNLFSNAIKYTSRNPQAKIDIRSAHYNGNLCITIEDNGVGFDQAQAEKLFGVFQRLHKANEFEGIGVGLANVRRIIVRHGGNISAKGVVNEGAKFTITLPMEVFNE